MNTEVLLSDRKQLIFYDMIKKSSCFLSYSTLYTRYEMNFFTKIARINIDKTWMLSVSIALKISSS